MPLYNIVKNIIEKVPEFKDFMKVKELYESSEELAKKYRGYIENVDVGPSRTELPVKALIIHGSEDKRVLAFAFPHPNEPIGSLTLEFLSKYLAEDNDLRRKATWIFIKVADVFGTILNEEWFKGPFDIKKYALNYYRPPASKQIEWSFPIEYKDLKWDKPLPETRAIMKLINEWKPTHIYSLHNAGFTGTYYYLTKKPSEETLNILKNIPNEFKVPIHKGEAETPYMEKIDMGIFRMPSVKDEYDWLEKYLGRSPVKDIKHGGSSYDYALKINQNVFELICEVPYIYDYRLDNDLEIGIPRREILKIVHTKEKEMVEIFDEIIREFEDEFSSNNPFYETLKEFIESSKIDLEAEKKWIEETPELNKSATVAQAFDSYLHTYFTPLFRFGLLYRAAEYEILRLNNIEVFNRIKEDALRHLERHLEDFNRLVKYKIIPINDLVKIQVASMISTIISV